jgi:hypothetical protein
MTRLGSKNGSAQNTTGRNSAPMHKCEESAEICSNVPAGKQKETIVSRSDKFILHLSSNKLFAVNSLFVSVIVLHVAE